ncbi:MAG: hypothetical protein ACLFQB_09905 [Chitinispirillaceae bacterium]
MSKKRVPYLDDKYRKDFLDSMARKLAVPESEILAVPKKPKLFLYFIPGLVAIIIGITAFILFASPRENVSSDEQIMPSKAVNPALKLSQSYQKCELGMDEYAGYLCDILVRYDSLPGKYKAEVPLIRPEQVKDTLVNLWPRLRASTKRNLLDDIPEMSEKPGIQTASLED